MVAHCRQHGLRRLPRGGQNLHSLRRSPVQQVARRAHRGAQRGTVGLKQDMTTVVRLSGSLIFGGLILKIAFCCSQEALMILIDLDLADRQGESVSD